MKKFSISIVCIISILQGLASASDFRFSPRENRADLIEWRTWGRASLEEAEKTNKPILLSLSAIWCHWCHVMDETTYSDLRVITFINKNFIPIRVDSDQRPDIDSLYNQGGWPSTVVLTPEGEIIEGGTYMPPETMLQWLSTAVQAFGDKSGKQNGPVTESKKNGQTETGSSAPGGADIEDITNLLTSSHDETYGGFGRGQKFPIPDAIDFLLAEYVVKKESPLKTVISTTLDRMAAGEIHDRVEGGFFRYSTRRDWREPHYEKMLSVNAGMIRNYATAYMVFARSEYLQSMTDSLRYVINNLLNRKIGAFYGSQDADETYYLEKNRKDRKPPRVDRTVYADANAQMIDALICAYQATGRSEYLRMARKAADFIISNLYSRDEGVFHYYLRGHGQTPGLISDNLLFGLALIDLYNVTGQKKYMDLADSLAQFVLSTFYDPAAREFTLSDRTTVVVPSSVGPLLDANRTTSNYRAAIFLSRLSHYKKNDIFKPVIKDTLARFKEIYSLFSPSAALYGTALRLDLRGPVEITLIAEPDRRDSFLTRLNRVYIPDKVMKMYSPKQDPGLISQSGYPPEEAMYLCVRKKCSPAIKSEENISAAVGKFLGYPARPGNTGR